MRVLCFGSINIDIIFRVPHLVAPGETLAAESVRQCAGGKGANQSVALARAGAKVFHAGQIGTDGQWVLDELRSSGVDVSMVVINPQLRTGSAFIQVADNGENSIILDGGANRTISREQIDVTLSRFGNGDVLLLQNEINGIDYLMRAGKTRGLRIVFNCAPAEEHVRGYPLDLVDLLIANATEAKLLSGKGDPEAAIAAMPGKQLIITLGERGALYQDASGTVRVPAMRVDAVDTTAAGDTFVGYFVAAQMRGDSPVQSLKEACAAAAVCVTRAGAIPSIPRREEVLAAM